jgi:hypothetical protein
VYIYVSWDGTDEGSEDGRAASAAVRPTNPWAPINPVSIIELHLIFASL